MEEQLLRARLAYIRTRGDLWTALAKLAVEHRASVYRVTDVGKLCDVKTTSSKIRKLRRHERRQKRDQHSCMRLQEEVKCLQPLNQTAELADNDTKRDLAGIAIIQ